MWLRRTVVAIVVAVALVGLALLGAAFLPRWWSHRVAHQVNGSMSVGIMLGLFYGFVFTALPLVTVLRAFRKRRPWKVWASLAALAISTRHGSTANSKDLPPRAAPDVRRPLAVSRVT